MCNKRYSYSVNDSTTEFLEGILLIFSIGKYIYHPVYTCIIENIIKILSLYIICFIKKVILYIDYIFTTACEFIDKIGCCCSGEHVKNMCLNELEAIDIHKQIIINNLLSSCNMVL